MKVKTQRPKLMGQSESCLRRKLSALRACIKKSEEPQIKNLTIPLKDIGKKSTPDLQSGQNENIKIRAEINEMETNKQTKPSQNQ